MLIFYLTVMVPIGFYLEWCIVYHFNELVRSFSKSEDYDTLLNKTGNPFFVLWRKNDETNEILH